MRVIHCYYTLYSLFFDSCLPKYTGFLCEVTMATLVEEVEENKAWVAGVVLAVLLMVACAATLIYFLHTKRYCSKAVFFCMGVVRLSQ